MIGRERLDLVATVRDEAEESLHPVGVVLQRANIGERFGLRREAGIWLTVSTARLPALAGLAGIEECLRRLGDRLCFCGGRHDRPLISKNPRVADAPFAPSADPRPTIPPAHRDRKGSSPRSIGNSQTPTSAGSRLVHVGPASPASRRRSPP